jgi:hypothetical protein
MTITPWSRSDDDHPIAKLVPKTVAGVLADAATADIVVTRPGPVLWISARRVKTLPPGTEVLVVRADGSILQTVTTAETRELGGQPVVDCDGISGPYHLRCIFVRHHREGT